MSKWNEYPKKKPTKDGRYLVVSKSLEDKTNNVNIAYFDKDRWIDINRLCVFNSYEVYSAEPGPDGCEVLCRKMRDSLCDLTDIVIKWKELPKC